MLDSTVAPGRAGRGAGDDPGYDHHLYYWNHFRLPTAQEAEQLHAEGWSSDPAGLRLHVIGCLWDANQGMETNHLWHWDGAQLHLLQEGYRRIEH